MPAFGFGRKEQPQFFTADITDKEDLKEIKEIAEMLSDDENINPSKVTCQGDTPRSEYCHEYQ